MEIRVLLLRDQSYQTFYDFYELLKQSLQEFRFSCLWEFKSLAKNYNRNYLRILSEFFPKFLTDFFFIKRNLTSSRIYPMFLSSFSQDFLQVSSFKHLQGFNEYFPQGFCRIFYKILVQDYFGISIEIALRIP